MGEGERPYHLLCKTSPESVNLHCSLFPQNREVEESRWIWSCGARAWWDEEARVLHPSRPLTHAVIGRRATVTAPTGDGVQLALGDHSVLRV